MNLTRDSLAGKHFYANDVILLPYPRVTKGNCDLYTTKEEGRESTSMGAIKDLHATNHDTITTWFLFMQGLVQGQLL